MDPIVRASVCRATCAWALAVCAACCGADIIRVPQDQPTIQAAIDAAVFRDEIVVSPGTYEETIDLLGKAILLRSTDGAGVTTIDARGGGSTVTCADGEGRGTVIEGFTITGGAATDGAGMLNDGSQPIVRDCIFSGNTASVGGGGMANLNFACPRVERCLFERNFAVDGGGMLNRGSSPVVIDCVFELNSATGNGGGLANMGSRCAEIFRCTFRANNGRWGGGMSHSGGSNPRVNDCVFINNTAESVGGGMANKDGTPWITRCVFVSNDSPFGGGMGNDASSGRVSDCIFAGNTSGSGGAIMNERNSSTLIRESVFCGNFASEVGGGAFNLESGPSFVNCTLVGNLAGDRGGAMRNDTSNPRVIGCTFNGNSAGTNGGGMFNNGDSRPTVENSILWGNNLGEIRGPGVATVRYSDVQGGVKGMGNIAEDPLFAPGASGVWTAAGSYDPISGRSTFVDATASWAPGELIGLILNPDASQFLQSLVVDNTETTVTVWGDLAEVGGIGASYELLDCHLTAKSPCVDAGDPKFEGLFKEMDRDGELRVLEGGIVDMGSDEFASARLGDLNCDGSIDAFDIEPFLSALFDPDEYRNRWPGCDRRLLDVNCDGQGNAHDIVPFLFLLFGHR